ncbi:MAG: hypothetical protein WAN51_08060 [Alphaproteobacteria bacterium]
MRNSPVFSADGLSAIAAGPEALLRESYAMAERPEPNDSLTGDADFDQELIRLNAQLRIELEAALDAVDYRRLRNLARTIRAGHRAPDIRNWDVPSSHLQQVIGAVSASRQLLDELAEAQILQVLTKNSEAIRSVLCRAVLAALDGRAIEAEWLSVLLWIGMRENHLGPMTVEGGELYRISEIHLAEALVVAFGESVPWQERPRIDYKIAARRVKLLAIAGQITAGGLLTIANLGLGIAGTLAGVIPALLGGVVPVYAGMAASAYTGANGTFGGLKDLSKALEPHE